MIVVDTTILVYAVGADHPLQEPCRRFVRAVAGGELSASTTVEVIQELVEGLALFEETPGLGAFDCVLARTATRAGAHGLASADKGFASVEGLRHLDPGAPGSFLPARA